MGIPDYKALANLSEEELADYKAPELAGMVEAAIQIVSGQDDFKLDEVSREIVRQQADEARFNLTLIAQLARDDCYIDDATINTRHTFEGFGFKYHTESLEPTKVTADLLEVICGRYDGERCDYGELSEESIVLAPSTQNNLFIESGDINQYSSDWVADHNGRAPFAEDNGTEDDTDDDGFSYNAAEWLGGAYEDQDSSANQEDPYALPEDWGEPVFQNDEPEEDGTELPPGFVAASDVLDGKDVSVSNVHDSMASQDSGPTIEDIIEQELINRIVLDKGLQDLARMVDAVMSDPSKESVVKLGYELNQHVKECRKVNSERYATSEARLAQRLGERYTSAVEARKELGDRHLAIDNPSITIGREERDRLLDTFRFESVQHLIGKHNYTVLASICKEVRAGIRTGLIDNPGVPVLPLYERNYYKGRTRRLNPTDVQIARIRSEAKRRDNMPHEHDSTTPAHEDAAHEESASELEQQSQERESAQPAKPGILGRFKGLFGRDNGADNAQDAALETDEDQEPERVAMDRRRPLPAPLEGGEEVELFLTTHSDGAIRGLYHRNEERANALARMVTYTRFAMGVIAVGATVGLAYVNQSSQSANTAAQESLKGVAEVKSSLDAYVGSTSESLEALDAKISAQNEHAEATYVSTATLGEAINGLVQESQYQRDQLDMSARINDANGRVTRLRDAYQGTIDAISNNTHGVQEADNRLVGTESAIEALQQRVRELQEQLNARPQPRRGPATPEPRREPETPVPSRDPARPGYESPGGLSNPSGDLGTDWRYHRK